MGELTFQNHLIYTSFEVRTLHQAEYNAVMSDLEKGMEALAADGGLDLQTARCLAMESALLHGLPFTRIVCRGTSLMINCTHLEPYTRPSTTQCWAIWRRAWQRYGMSVSTSGSTVHLQVNLNCCRLWAIRPQTAS